MIRIEEQEEQQKAETGEHGKAEQPKKEFRRPAALLWSFRNHPNQTNGDHGHEISQARHQQRVALVRRTRLADLAERIPADPLPAPFHQRPRAGPGPRVPETLL